MKYFILILFMVRVYIPFAGDKIYRNVKSVEPHDGKYYKLVLENDKIAYVPMMVTVIEEE